jgi:hypothetical protein
MRTTLTLEDDVAVLVTGVRKTGRGSLKDIVNEALRRGLREMVQPADEQEELYRTPAVDLGRCLIGNVDDVSEHMTTSSPSSSKTLGIRTA